MLEKKHPLGNTINTLVWAIVKRPVKREPLVTCRDERKRLCPPEREVIGPEGPAASSVTLMTGWADSGLP